MPGSRVAGRNYRYVTPVPKAHALGYGTFIPPFADAPILLKRQGGDAFASPPLYLQDSGLLGQVFGFDFVFLGFYSSLANEFDDCHRG